MPEFLCVGELKDFEIAHRGEIEPQPVITTPVGTMEKAEAFGRMARVEAERRGAALIENRDVLSAIAAEQEGLGWRMLLELAGPSRRTRRRLRALGS